MVSLRDGVLLNQPVLDYLPVRRFGVGGFSDRDVEIDFQQETTANDVVTVIAT
ncbi:hypothetical protein ACNKHQ_01625 [Shigella flexneri]